MSESFDLRKRLLGTKDTIRDVKKENAELKKLTDLEIEDYLLVVEIECCTGCGLWIKSEDVADDESDEPNCADCCV